MGISLPCEGYAIGLETSSIVKSPELSAVIAIWVAALGKSGFLFLLPIKRNLRFFLIIVDPLFLELALLELEEGSIDGNLFV